MKEKGERITVAEIYFQDENSPIEFKLPQGEESFVTSISRGIIEKMSRGDSRPLEILLAVVVHALAMERTGNLERDFIRNVKRSLPKYRDVYRKMAIEMMEKEKRGN